MQSEFDVDQTDRRNKPVYLTAKGRAPAERVMADVASSDGDLISRALSNSEIARMTRLLRTWNQADWQTDANAAVQLSCLSVRISEKDWRLRVTSVVSITYAQGLLLPRNGTKADIAEGPFRANMRTYGITTPGFTTPLIH